MEFRVSLKVTVSVPPFTAAFENWGGTPTAPPGVLLVTPRFWKLFTGYRLTGRRFLSVWCSLPPVVGA